MTTTRLSSTFNSTPSTLHGLLSPSNCSKNLVSSILQNLQTPAPAQPRTRHSAKSQKIGILSVDIDGNDYWVWKALTCVEPSIVICEYNCLFGFDLPWTIKYDPSFVRGTHFPFSFYGTSLRSACDLAESRGLRLIGCNGAGNNAYFIRHELLEHLPLPDLTPEQAFQFSSFSESSLPDGLPCRGPDKIQALQGLPVVNTQTGSEERFDADIVIHSLRAAGKLTRDKSTLSPSRHSTHSGINS